MWEKNGIDWIRTRHLPSGSENSSTLSLSKKEPMGDGHQPGVAFYPVLHLLTGPPGLTRNGGIWKRLKANLRDVALAPRIMVQAMHFVPYKLSPSAWESWFPPGAETSRLALDLERLLGPRRDVFVDSGGFQLLHADKIDLSRWGYKLDAESIFTLQNLYGAQRVASLDSPIPPAADLETAARLMEISIRNAVWLAEHIDTTTNRPRPYLVAHGRTPDEVRTYLRRLERKLPRGWLRSHEYGLALGSQVPLSGNPELVVSNIESLLDWMKRSVNRSVDAHIFGVGDGIIGTVIRGEHGHDRPLSYDNSTYVQKAFRFRIFDPRTQDYVELDINRLPRCGCAACNTLADLGVAALADVLAGRPYSKHEFDGGIWYKSDVLALTALHNLRWWRARLRQKPRRQRINFDPAKRSDSTRHRMGYLFPLPNFRPAAESVLFVPCSKWRPYTESKSHRRIRAYLASHRLTEGSEFDRITLSGVYGPVHWKDERLPTILNYDHSLSSLTAEKHIQSLRVRTASVLGVVGKRYSRKAAYLRKGPYEEAFGPTLREFGVKVTDQLDDLPDLLERAA